jgi:hypothetical protein
MSWQADAYGFGRRIGPVVGGHTVTVLDAPCFFLCRVGFGPQAAPTWPTLLHTVAMDRWTEHRYNLLVLFFPEPNLFVLEAMPMHDDREESRSG